MTDSRISRGALQALEQLVPDVRISRAAVQSLLRPAAPVALISRAGVQVVHRPPDTEAWISRGALQALVITKSRPAVRSESSSAAVKMMQPDRQWWPMTALA